MSNTVVSLQSIQGFLWLHKKQGGKCDGKIIYQKSSDLADFLDNCFWSLFLLRKSDSRHGNFGTLLYPYPLIFILYLLLFVMLLFDPCFFRYTLPKTNIAPENRPGPKRKFAFQPSIFRCKLAVNYMTPRSVLGRQWTF